MRVKGILPAAASILVSLQRCPKILPNEITAAATALADAYLGSTIRPRLSPEVLLHWDSLIDEWSETPDLPLFIRKQSANIGELLKHRLSGRLLAPCDNSPAHWSIIKAFDRGTHVTIKDIRAEIRAHKVPVCMVMNLVEIAESAMKGVCAKQLNATKLGWKVDHVMDVGLKKRKKIEDISLADLKAHFCRLMKPSNIALVPSTLKGLGDMPAFLTAIRNGA